MQKRIGSFLRADPAISLYRRIPTVVNPVANWRAAAGA